uniref:Mucosal vascular addressin cell adhesion molecule 1 n=1 Tax=Microcebus murinus TaxID=30608 RepID=A0A8C5XVN9_MICMU
PPLLLTSGGGGLLGLQELFPLPLSVSPATLVPGVDQEVACTAHKVTPVGPDTLSFSLLLGDRALEGVRTLGPPEVEEEEPQEDEDPLFHVTERWLLPPLGTPTPPALHCQATMRLPGVELSHSRPIPAPSPGPAQLPTDLWMGSVVLALLLLSFLAYRLHPPASPRGPTGQSSPS